MKIRNQWLKYGPMQEASDAGDPGQGGGGAPKADPPPADPPKADPPADPPKTSEAEAKLLKEVMAKKERLKEVEAELERFKGVDLDAYKKFQEDKAASEAAAAEAERKRLEQAGEWSRLREQLVTQHDAEKAALQTENETLKAQLAAQDQATKELSIGNLFGNSKFLPEATNYSPAKARIIYGPHFEVGDNGEVLAFDKPKGAADRTRLVDGRGNPLTFDEALKKLVDSDPDKEQILKSEIKPGAGSGGRPGVIATPAQPAVHGVNRIKAGLSQVLSDD